MRHVNSYDQDAPLPGIGSIWVWELDQPSARELIEVTEVFWNSEEWWVRTESLLSDQHLYRETGGGTHLNDLSVFWEAVTPVRQTRTARPSVALPIDAA